MTAPNETDSVLGGGQQPANTSAVLGGVLYREIQSLNLRWSEEAPKQGDRLVKGYPVGIPFMGSSLRVNYLLDEKGDLWDIEHHVKAWMKPLGMSGIGFPYEILGCTERISALIANDSLTEYYKLNALCYAAVNLHTDEYAYSSVFNTSRKHNSRGFIKSIALIADEDELRHRWSYVEDRWHPNNPTHPNIPLLEIPPQLTPERVEWLKNLSKGEKVKIISPFFARYCQSPVLLYPQEGIIQRVGKKIIRVNYSETRGLGFYKMASYDADAGVGFGVSVENGIKSRMQQPTESFVSAHSWIEPA